METTLFPFDTPREVQVRFIEDVEKALNECRGLLAHAPTGLGKTAGALAPALHYAMKHDKTIFFLTSRHTQHKIAVDTLQSIRKKHGVRFHCSDLIGKKHMCLVPGIGNLHSGEFFDYCRRVREDNSCEFYNNTKDNGHIRMEAKVLLDELKMRGPLHVEQIRLESQEKKMCPYEMGMFLGKDARVIIADYYYVFHPRIFTNFLARTGKQIEDCIIIVDEGHNLPQRLRDLMTHRLTLNVANRAIREAHKFEYVTLESQLVHLRDILMKISEGVMGEKEVSQDAFSAPLDKLVNYTAFVENLEAAAEMVRVEAKMSFMGSIAQFLDAWRNQDTGFVRYVEVEPPKGGSRDKRISLFYKCLDPSILSKEVVNQAHSTIVMSGTLTPTDMYKDILGFDDDTYVKEYESPFPAEHRLDMIVPKTSTRYATRGEAQYANIATILAEIVNNVPGNSAVFFPSYHLRDQVYKKLNTQLRKTTFLESPGLSNYEKFELLEKFKEYHKTGAILLGVAGGSFGEGIDLPGDFLKAVVVVGLPLKQPNIETKALISYYDDLYGRGWDYGYTFPALNLVFQAAGRCIRTKNDKGVMIFLDERYSWNNYLRCFPNSWDVKISGLYKDRVIEFFEQWN